MKINKTTSQIKIEYFSYVFNLIYAIYKIIDINNKKCSPFYIKYYGKGYSQA